MHGFGIAVAFGPVAAFSFWAGWEFLRDDTEDDQYSRAFDAAYKPDRDRRSLDDLRVR